MSKSKLPVMWTLAIAAALCLWAAPALASSCHAHAHSHDQCGKHTRSRTKSGWSSLSCDASTNTPGVHSHAFAHVDCFLFFCNKVVGGHSSWKNGCGPKHRWWHARAGTGRFVIVGDEPTAEIEVLIPVDPPPETLPPPTGERLPEGALVRQGISTADDAVVDMSVKIGIGLPDGGFASLLEGEARLGGPRSRTPGLRASGALERVLGRRVTGEREGLARVQVAEDYVSRRVKVPTNQELEFVFDLEVGVGGDDPKEGDVRDSSPPDGDRGASAASLGATLRLVDQTGRFVLKALDRKESDEREEEGPIPTDWQPVSCKLTCVVQGTPVEFPDDILITNASQTTCPQGTSIDWSLPGFSGTYVLTQALAPGQSTFVAGVLQGGMEAGRKCVAVLTP